MDSRRKCTCGEVFYEDEWKTHKCIPIKEEVTKDMVNHPLHYKQHPSGVECITVTEHFNFNVGNAIKYLWRSDHKNGLEDLKKAAWYVNREIQKREGILQIPSDDPFFRISCTVKVKPEEKKNV